MALPSEPAFGQVRQTSVLETLQELFRPKRRPAGTRGPICLITPGLKPESVPLSAIPLVLNDRPLLIWERPVARVDLRSSDTNRLVWNQSFFPDRQRSIYQGVPLQPGQIYQIIAFDHKNRPLNAGEDAQFILVGRVQRNQILRELAIQESELKQQNRSSEAIAIAKAIQLTQRGLLSDAYQMLDSLPSRSPELNAFLTSLSAEVCGSE